MGLSNFIPVVWAAEALEALNNAHVYASLCNRDYEGDITGYGDSVKINMIGNPTISDYTKNSDISAAEALTDAGTTLLIDKAKSFNFVVDDIDKAQTKPKVMQSAMRAAAWGLADAVDTGLAGLYAQIPSVNTVGTAATPIVCGSLTAGSALYDKLVDLGVILDQNNVPNDGQRWVVLPAWARGMIAKDSRWVANTPLGVSIL